MDFFHKVYIEEIEKVCGKRLNNLEELNWFLENIRKELTDDQLQELSSNVYAALFKNPEDRKIERDYPPKRPFPKLSNSPPLQFP